MQVCLVTTENSNYMLYQNVMVYIQVVVLISKL